MTTPVDFTASKCIRHIDIRSPYMNQGDDAFNGRTALTTIGPRCRAQFTERFLELLGDRAVPAALKLAWNERGAAILA
jgi:hypothetical protein